MLAPINLTRSCLVINTKGKKSLLSTTFIAYFGNGVEKFLNKKEWIFTSLLKSSQVIGFVENEVLNHSNCCLYFRDWTNVPSFSSFEKDYPSTPIIPSEILDLI